MGINRTSRMVSATIGRRLQLGISALVMLLAIGTSFGWLQVARGDLLDSFEPIDAPLVDEAAAGVFFKKERRNGTWVTSMPWATLEMGTSMPPRIEPCWLQMAVRHPAVAHRL